MVRISVCKIFIIIYLKNIFLFPFPVYVPALMPLNAKLSFNQRNENENLKQNLLNLEDRRQKDKDKTYFNKKRSNKIYYWILITR